MNRLIYFNPTVSDYLKVKFYNLDEQKVIKCENILLCPLVSWDIDTKKSLEDMKEKEIVFTGMGDGWWKYYQEQHQNNPNHIEDKSNKAYNRFMKGGGLFI
jgi:hypothetical protein